MYATEVYNRKSLGLRSMSDESLEMLRTAQQGQKQFRGNNNYQILQNLTYMAAFQYQSLDMRNEEIDSILSDVVTKILYLAPNYAVGGGGGGEGVKPTMNSSLIKAEMLKKMIKNKKGAGTTTERKTDLN